MCSVDVQTSLFNDKYEILDGVTKKATFLDLQGDADNSYYRIDFVYMAYLFLHGFGVDHDMIEINYTYIPLNPLHDHV